MVKEKFIRNLYDAINRNPKFTFADFTIEQKKTTTRGIQTISTVAGKSLTEQVKILKKYTYIIEINQ